MKTKSLIVIAASFGLIGSAYAEHAKGEHNKGEHHMDKLPPEILKKFDKDGDGKLNDEEREAAKAAREEMMKAHRAEMLKKYDKDGDGKLSEEEETTMRQDRRKMILERFDKNKDGELNDEEKAEMRKAMMEHGEHHNGEKHHDSHDGKVDPKVHGDGDAPGVAQ